jgi:hypothetical protein
MRGHSPNIRQEVKDTIVFIKGHFPNMKPRQIRVHIKQNLKMFKLNQNQVPSVRSIQKILNKPENRKNIERIKNDALNQRWNIGLGMKYGITANIVPVLIKIKQNENLSDDLTIRKARWIEYLYPTLELIFKRRRPNINQEERIGLIYLIAENYAKLEEIFEIKNGVNNTPIHAMDTSDIDNMYLVKEDISNENITGLSVNIQFFETERLLSSLLTSERIRNIKEHPITEGELKAIWGKFSQKAANRLNEAVQKANREIEQYKENMEKDGELK